MEGSPGTVYFYDQEDPHDGTGCPIFASYQWVQTRITYTESSPRYTLKKGCNQSYHIWCKHKGPKTNSNTRRDCSRSVSYGPDSYRQSGGLIRVSSVSGYDVKIKTVGVGYDQESDLVGGGGRDESTGRG